MADIARETGLTLGTVSRALNTEGKYAIATETRERVIEAAARLGYRPNLIGRALAAGSAALILLVSPDPFASYYVEISRHLSVHASQDGYTFVTGGALPQNGATGIPANDWLYGVDGMIVCDYLPHQEAYITEALRLKIPMVGLGVRHPFPTDFVKVDIYSATRDLLAHLIAAGCKDIAMMRAPGTHQEDPRMRAFLEMTADHGLEPKFVACRNQSRLSGREAVVEAVRSGQKMDALFCENDTLTVGALRGLSDLGIRVPEDMLLAGCDGLDDTIYQSTPLTTIAQPLEQMCEMAWRMLQARIEGSSGEPRVLDTVAELVIRESTTGAT